MVADDRLSEVALEGQWRDLLPKAAMRLGKRGVRKSRKNVSTLGDGANGNGQLATGCAQLETRINHGLELKLD